MNTHQVKKTAMLLGLALLFSIGVMAQPYYGQNDCPNRNNRPGRGQNFDSTSGQPGQGLINLLNLTEDQQTKLKELQLAHQKKVLPIKNAIAEKKAKLRTLETADNADMKAINALIDDISNQRSQLMKERANMQQDIRKMLTDEQRIIFDSHQGFGRGRGQGAGRGYCQGRNF